MLTCVRLDTRQELPELLRSPVGASLLHDPNRPDRSELTINECANQGLISLVLNAVLCCSLLLSGQSCATIAGHARGWAQVVSHRVYANDTWDVSQIVDKLVCYKYMKERYTHY